MSILNEIRNHKIRFIKTCVICLCYASIGISSNLSGPAILDLRQTVGASQEEINNVFMFSSGGYVLGSLIIGIINERVNTQISYAIALSAVSALTIALPWNRSLYGMLATAFVMQAFSAVIDCIGNVWVLRLWGPHNGPFSQAVHMTWGIGAFFAPVVAAPFLVDVSSNNNTNNTNEIDVEIPKEQIGELRIQWAFGIAGVYCALCVLMIVIVFFIKRSDKPHPAKIEQDKGRTKLSKWKKFYILALISFMFHFYLSIEVTAGRLLTPFSVFSELKLNKATGAYITSMYWGTFTFSRCLTIFIIHFIGPKWMLWFDFTIVIIASCILIVFGQVYETALWIGASLVGLGLSSIYPSLFALTEDLLPVTPRIGALFLVVGVSGELILPYLSGIYIETFPMLYIYLTALASVLMFALYAALCFVTRNINNNRNTK